jgi:hypothetical protein
VAKIGTDINKVYNISRTLINRIVGSVFGFDLSPENGSYKVDGINAKEIRLGSVRIVWSIPII